MVSSLRLADVCRQASNQSALCPSGRLASDRCSLRPVRSDASAQQAHAIVFPGLPEAESVLENALFSGSPLAVPLAPFRAEPANKVRASFENAAAFGPRRIVFTVRRT
jgi:hypothetical protein